MRRKKRMRIISTLTVMCNILLHYTRANCICCICIHLYSCMCMCIYSIHNIYTPTHACTHLYMLTYFDSGRLADAGGGWCLVTALISEAASHFWFNSKPAEQQLTEQNTPRIIPYIKYYFSKHHQSSKKIFLDSKVVPYSSSSTFSLAVFWLLMRNCMGIR